MSTCADVGSFIESKTSVVQASNVGFTFEVSDYLVLHTGPDQSQATAGGTAVRHFLTAGLGVSGCVLCPLCPWQLVTPARYIIIIIIALKGAIRDFYILLTALRTFSNTYVQVAKGHLCANNVQHVKRLSRATCRVPRGTKGQFSSYEV